MKFFFPDSQDQIDPTFDFVLEESSPYRVRQRDDLYAHEALGHAPYDGILLSKAIIDGIGAAGRYSAAHRNRLYREGMAKFFRFDAADRSLEAMGDCGAFAYVREPVPPYTPDEVIDFYEACEFDCGFSVDHVILGFDARADEAPDNVEPEWKGRQALTIELATEFLGRHEARRCAFEPIGVAQGGMVPLKTPEILTCLDAVAAVLESGVEVHLLGVTRLESIAQFEDYGVTSFDSTSPFRQAFMDADDNYYELDRALCAVRIPQSDGNTTLRNRIGAGELPQEKVRDLEDAALAGVRAYAANADSLENALDAVCSYEELVTGRPARRADYERTLATRSWEVCECGVCQSAGVDVVLFRGKERNKRRGFHNLEIFRERLDRRLECEPA
jgi:hypothetical protein